MSVVVRLTAAGTGFSYQLAGRGMDLQRELAHGEGVLLVRHAAPAGSVQHLKHRLVQRQGRFR